MAQPIFFLTHEFFPKRGGIAQYVEELVRATVDDGYPAEIWAPAKPALLARREQLPCPLHPLPVRGTMNWSDRLRTARAIRARTADLASATVCLPEPGAIITAMYLNAAGLLPAGRLVLVLHGSEILRFARTPHRRWLFRLLLERADCVGVVSRFNIKLLEKHFPGITTPVRVVSGALRSDFPIEDEPVQTSEETVTLLTVARIHPRKGQDCVLRALAMLPESTQTRLHYRIVGPVVKADYQRLLEELASKTRAHVDFVGEVADDALPGLYRKADIFVMTSLPRPNSVEGFGLVYLEAGARGLPVIAHDTGGVAEAVRDGVTGLLVQPGDLQGLARSLQELATDPARRADLARNGLIRLRELSWQANARALFSTTG